LKTKKKKLETDKESLMDAVDDYDDKAERGNKLTLIEKSNAMRKQLKRRTLS